MQRLLGGLTGVLLDIQWINYKKTQWQESAKMYQWGDQLSRGVVIKITNETKQCTLHTHRHVFMDNLFRVVAIMLVAGMGIAWAVWRTLGPEASDQVLRAGSIILIIASALGGMHLGRIGRLLICKCG